MDYKHTYERDTFYTLSPEGRQALPRSIQNLKKLPKVRVTTNTKTGQPIAQIIKARIVDLDIYSPMTLFDWRISVNVEMNVGGELNRFIDTGNRSQDSSDRKKDRLSYKHQEYSIDLTQVTYDDVSPPKNPILIVSFFPWKGRGKLIVAIAIKNGRETT